MQLSAYLDAHIDEADLNPTVDINMELSPTDISFKLIKDLSRLEPFGQGIPEPRFLLKNITLRGSKLVGSSQTHLS